MCRCNSCLFASATASSWLCHVCSAAVLEEKQFQIVTPALPGVQDYRPGLTRADVETQQRAQRRAEGRPDDALPPERSHAQHAKTFDGPPPRGSGADCFLHTCTPRMWMGLHRAIQERCAAQPAVLLPANINCGAWQGPRRATLRICHSSASQMFPYHICPFPATGGGGGGGGGRGSGYVGLGFEEEQRPQMSEGCATASVIKLTVEKRAS